MSVTSTDGNTTDVFTGQVTLTLDLSNLKKSTHHLPALASTVVHRDEIYAQEYLSVQSPSVDFT
jgi:hypothetical protein